MDVSKRIEKFVFWTPRVLAILFIAFLALFSLDVFGQGYGFWGALLALFMHNIPTFVLVIILVIAWRREAVGAVAFIVAGLLYAVFIVINALGNPPLQWHYIPMILTISGPAFIVGILFLIGWRRKKGSRKARKRDKS
jgi:Na+/proline symporter